MTEHGIPERLGEAAAELPPPADTSLEHIRGRARARHRRRTAGTAAGLVGVLALGLGAIQLLAVAPGPTPVVDDPSDGAALDPDGTSIVVTVALCHERTSCGPLSEPEAMDQASALGEELDELELLGARTGEEHPLVEDGEGAGDLFPGEATFRIRDPGGVLAHVATLVAAEWSQDVRAGDMDLREPDSQGPTRPGEPVSTVTADLQVSGSDEVRRLRVVTYDSGATCLQVAGAGSCGRLVFHTGLTQVLASHGAERSCVGISAGLDVVDVEMEHEDGTALEVALAPFVDGWHAPTLHAACLADGELAGTAYGLDADGEVVATLDVDVTEGLG